jgi:1,4-alpha-glucan branching enzyme
MLTKVPINDASCDVTFEVPAAIGATTAHLCGEFNDWSTTACPMTPLPNAGFAVTIRLPAPGRFRFRYLLDGSRWANDWAADDYVPNGLGGDDSVVVT